MKKKQTSSDLNHTPQSAVSIFSENKSGCGFTCLKTLGDYDFNCSGCDLRFHIKCLKKRPHLNFKNQKQCPNCAFELWI